MLEVYRPRTYIKVHIYLLLIVLLREFISQVVSGGVLEFYSGVLGVYKTWRSSIVESWGFIRPGGVYSGVLGFFRDPMVT